MTLNIKYEDLKLIDIPDLSISKSIPPSDICWEGLTQSTSYCILIIKVILFKIVFKLYLLLVMPFIIIDIVYSDWLIMEFMMPLVVLGFNLVQIKSIWPSSQLSAALNMAMFQRYGALMAGSLFIPIMAITLVTKNTGMIFASFWIRYIIQVAFWYSLFNYWSRKPETLPKFTSDHKLLPIAEKELFESIDVQSSEEKSIQFCYQQIFDMVLFTVIFSVSSLVPIILVPGLFYFWVKYFNDEFQFTEEEPIEDDFKNNTRKTFWKLMVMSVNFYPFALAGALITTNQTIFIILGI